MTPARLTASSHSSTLPPITHNPSPTSPCTGTIQLFRLPQRGTNHASTMGDQRSLSEYGQVESANMASWE